MFENTKPDMKIITEEIFRPVVCAQPFEDDDLDRIAKGAEIRIRLCICSPNRSCHRCLVG